MQLRDRTGATCFHAEQKLIASSFMIGGEGRHADWHMTAQKSRNRQEHMMVVLHHTQKIRNEICHSSRVECSSVGILHHMTAAMLFTAASDKDVTMQRADREPTDSELVTLQVPQGDAQLGGVHSLGSSLALLPLGKGLEQADQGCHHCIVLQAGGAGCCLPLYCFGRDIFTHLAMNTARAAAEWTVHGSNHCICIHTTLMSSCMLLHKLAPDTGSGSWQHHSQACRQINIPEPHFTD